MDSESQPKMAFITPQGLFEFRAMSFSLPAVFQCLMQRTLMGLTPEEGPSLVSVYTKDHVNHLK